MSKTLQKTSYSDLSSTRYLMIVTCCGLHDKNVFLNQSLNLLTKSSSLVFIMNVERDVSTIAISLSSLQNAMSAMKHDLKCIAFLSIDPLCFQRHQLYC